MPNNRDDFVFLKGRPPMSEFLGVVKGQLELNDGDMKLLSEEWRQANQVLKSLEQSEAGIADNLAVQNLEPSLQALVQALEKNTVYNNAFAAVRPVIGLVELDKLVVFQKFVNLGFVNHIKHNLVTKPTAEQIFHLCFPVLGQSPLPKPEFETARVEKDGFVFMSPSADFRVLDARVYAADAVKTDQHNGDVSAVVAMNLGLGANCLSVMRVNNRLILNNGSHRAYALRSLGVTHAPCAVQNITRNDELPLVASPEFMANIAEYISQPRPPLLKDYFNDNLVKILPVKRKNRQIKVSFKVEVMDVPAI